MENRSTDIVFLEYLEHGRAITCSSRQFIYTRLSRVYTGMNSIYCRHDIIPPFHSSFENHKGDKEVMLMALIHIYKRFACVYISVIEYDVCLVPCQFSTFVTEY